MPASIAVSSPAHPENLTQLSCWHGAMLRSDCCCSCCAHDSQGQKEAGQQQVYRQEPRHQAGTHDSPKAHAFRQSVMWQPA